MYQQLKKQLLFLIALLGCSDTMCITASFSFSFNDFFSNPRLSAQVTDSSYGAGAQIHYDKKGWQITPHMAIPLKLHDEKASVARNALNTFLLHTTVTGVAHTLVRYQNMQPDKLPQLNARIKELTEENMRIAQQLQKKIDPNAETEFISGWKGLIATTPPEERASLILELENDIAAFPACASQLEQLKQNITP
jgi:hypothetical protein